LESKRLYCDGQLIDYRMDIYRKSENNVASKARDGQRLSWTVVSIASKAKPERRERKGDRGGRDDALSQTPDKIASTM